MHIRCSAAALAALAALAAAALAAPNRGVPAVNGDKLTGSLSPAGDSDAFVLDLSEGGLLSVKVAAGKGESLLPVISVLEPDGSSLPLAGFTKGDGTAKPQLKNLPLSETGLHAVVLTAGGSTTGVFTVSFKTKTPTKSKTLANSVPDGSTLDIGFTGDDGALLTFKAKATSGPGLASVAVLDPGAEEVPGASAFITTSGSTTQGKGIPLGQGFGRYGLRLTGAAGGATLADVQITVKFAKAAKSTRTLLPEPRIASVAPANGVEGSSVTINGSDLVAGARAWFGEEEAALSVGSSAAATTTAPAGFDPTLNIPVIVTLQNPDGQTATRAAGFTYLATPTLASVGPALSPLGGGVALTLGGTNFRSGYRVTVGGADAAAVTAVSSTQITCTSPAHAAGGTEVVVIDEFGRATAPLAGHSYVAPPVLDSVSPSLSPLAGGVSLTLAGSGFRAGATVAVGGTAATGVSVGSSSSITCTSPAHAAGAVTVVVSDEFGQSSSAVGGHAYVAAPSVTAASPSVLPLSGGQTVTLTGTDFRTSTILTVGGTAIPGRIVNSATSLSFTAPAKSAGAAAVKVEDEFGQSSTTSAVLSYAGAPTISSVSPAQVQAAGGQTVTVTGGGFRSGARVFLDGVEATPVSVGSATSLSFTAPAHAAGAVDVKVQDEYGQSSTSVDALSYVTLVVTSVTPSTGSGAGGTFVLVQGLGFDAAATVRFGAVEAYAINRVDGTSILCRVPRAASVSAAAATAVDVTVENTPGTDATLDDGFAYDADLERPAIDAVVPAAGATGVATNLQKVVYVMSEPLSSTNVTTGNFDFFRSSSSGTNDIQSPRVPSVALGPLDRFMVIQRGTATGGNLSSSSIYVGQVQVINQTVNFITDPAGNILDTPQFGTTFYQTTFTTGTTTDTTAPTISSTSPAASATGTDVDGSVSVTFSETVDPTTLAAAFTLKQSSTVIDGILALDDACKVLTFTPRKKLAANTTYTVGVSTALKDLSGNALASAWSGTFTTASADGTDPVQAVTVDGLPADLNGSGTYLPGTSNGGAPSGLGSATAFDAYLPRSGFTIDVDFTDLGGSGIDPSSFTFKCNKAMGSTSADTDLASLFTITQFRATWTVPSTHQLAAQSDVTFTSDVDDGAGNGAAQKTLVVDVADITQTITNGTGSAGTDRDPFNSRQSWLLRFDQDLYSISSASGGSGSHAKPIAITTSLSTNGTVDFKEDLTLVGLNGTESGTNASTVTNGSATGTNAIVQKLVKEAIRGRLNQRYGIDYDGTRGADAAGIEFLLEGETKSGGGTVTFSGWTSGSGYSMMTFTGDEQANASGGTIGRALLDFRNTSQENDSNSGATNGSNLGTFATHMIRVRINDPDSTTFPKTFDPLISTASRGGTPVGASNDDGVVLAGSFSYASGTSGQKARYDLIMTAIDRYALYLSLVGAHEIGHSTGLVPDGAPPTGLFGNAHPNNTFIASGGLTTSGHIDTAGPNVMEAAASFGDSIATGSDFAGFGPLNMAYLLRRMIYDK